MKALGLLLLAGIVLAPNANAAPPDVENRFVQLVKQHTGTTADRQTILSATYDDVCGPVRPMTAFDLGNRLGIDPITQAGVVRDIAISVGLCL
jgi:hypothetical protein